MRIAFALAAHLPKDERVFFQQGDALLRNKHELFIISMTKKVKSINNFYCFDYTGLSYVKKIKNFYYYLSIINPDIIICDSPISIFSSKIYGIKKKRKELKIYYDITEFHLSKISFNLKKPIKYLLKLPLLISISIIAAWIASGYIFGEYYKAIPYRLLFWKKFVYLSYYASIEHINIYPINNTPQKFVLYFAGKINNSSGYYNFLDACKVCAKRFPKINFVLKIVSDDVEKAERTQQVNLTYEFSPLLPFEEFCNDFGKADLFFDLRKINIENTHCLPIKLFYYMAAGRPVVYSNLKAIKKGIPEIYEFGHLVNPDKTDKIAGIIAQYIQNRDIYMQHCIRARQLVETKYNWKNIENNFIEFIEK